MHSPLNAPIFKSAEGDRSATWLELFFDLVFVVTVASLVYQLEHNFSWAGLGAIALFFFPVWWLWMEYSYFADLYDDNSVFYQTAMVFAMGGVAKMSIVLRHFDILNGHRAFTWCYIYLAAVVLALYLRAWWHTPEKKWFPRSFVISISTGIAIWIGSLWLSGTYRYAAWILAVIIQASCSPVIYLTRDDYPVQLSHMPERFGLFSIIVLGEGIVSITSGGFVERLTATNVIAEVAGFLLVVCLWKLYFYEANKDSLTTALRDDARKDTVRSFFYGYGHFPLYISIVIVSVAILELLHETLNPGHAETGQLARIALHGGASLFLLSITLIHWAAPESLFSRIILYRSVCLVISAGLLLIDLPAAGELAAQTGVLLSLILVEYLTYRDRGVLPGEEEAEISNTTGS